MSEIKQEFMVQQLAYAGSGFGLRPRPELCIQGQRHLPRPPRHRGGVANKRGITAEQIPVLVVRDRSGQTADQSTANFYRAFFFAELISWYGLGCSVLVAATYLLRALHDANSRRRARVFQTQGGALISPQ